MARYQVTAPYVLVKLNTFTGPEVRGFDRNVVLPEEADDDDVQRLLRKGMIAEFDGPDVGAIAPPHMEADQAAEGAQAAAEAQADQQAESAPARSARKEVWVAYAQSVGDVPEDELADMTKDQIAEHYLGPAE